MLILKYLNFIAHVIVLMSLVRLPPKTFLHNSMNLSHIGHAHIIPAVTVLLFTFLYSFKYMCTSSKLRNTHIIGTS